MCHTLSLENHQDGVYLHRHGVTLSLQAILVFKFACVISQGFGLLLNKLYYNCMSDTSTLHIEKLCKIKVSLDLFYQAISLCNYTKVVWLWWYTPRYLFLLRVWESQFPADNIICKAWQSPNKSQLYHVSVSLWSLARKTSVPKSKGWALFVLLWFSPNSWTMKLTLIH